MAAQAEGMPCWADAMFTDIEKAKEFYGDVLGWTFGESATEFGNYTEAYSDGKAVAAVVPPMPGQEGKSAWCLYFASPDAAATAEKIRAAGGELLMEPMTVGDFGTMVLARDPAGVTFGVWQAGTHEGFQKRGEPGAYCWAEVFTREPGKADAFFPAVFPYGLQHMEGEADAGDEQTDFKLFSLGGDTVLGRMAMGEEFPPEIPPYIQVFFAVGDCDAAVAKARDRGGELHFGPMDSPFGRFAALTDSQGASFAVIDLNTTKGAMPGLTDEK
ncbi:VOC family protein [Streptomyces roseifaciens]|uniref:VOC family protein n=1 Tax=Streptomyces roseifaciens TaxID=1488406 RepID=UPI000718029F|nr:VOC family protein [Streptomyces roseifaciens]